VDPFLAGYALLASRARHLEGRWTGEHLEEREGELAQTAGLNYEIVAFDSTVQPGPVRHDLFGPAEIFAL